MKLNWFSYYLTNNGFGRSSSRLVKALQNSGVDVAHMTAGDLERPDWMLKELGYDKDALSISYWDLGSIHKVPGRHWLFTMCEGNKLAKFTINRIKKSNIERLIVPSEYCADVFADANLDIPISIVHLGTDPLEFPLAPKREGIYTFLALADRGDRKGWHEVYDAFYKAFGGKITGEQKVRLIIKSLPKSNPMLTKISKADNWDHRIFVDMQDYPSMADFYAKGDCMVLPSRSEGWGMPHREAAMMGLPVILQKNSGLDDGYTENWAIPVPMGRVADINDKTRLGGGGTWEIANVNRLAEEMLDLYNNPDQGREFGLKARQWLSSHQTWNHSAFNLKSLIRRDGSYHGNDLEDSSYNGISSNGSRFRESNLSVGAVRSY